MDKTGFIYGLVDPRNGAVCYVGQTICKLSKRLVEHCAAPHTKALCKWVNELEREGLKPLIELLEEVPRECLNAYEDYWMGEMAYRGMYLLNARLSQAATNAYLGGWQPERPT